MVNFVESMAAGAENRKDIRSQDNLNGQAFPVFKLFNESITLHNTVIVETRDVSLDTKWGLFNWGEANWDDRLGGDGFILGHPTNAVLGISQLGAPSGVFSIVRIVHHNNTYIDDFSNYNYIDTTNSTAIKSGDSWIL